MGCCGNKINNKYSSMEFYIDLFTLEPENSKGKKFLIKKLETQKFDKTIEKTLKEYLKGSKILKNKILGNNFQFNINNALFYCYLNETAIVKNYLQVKDLEPFNFETLIKISILLTKNYDKLTLPKINLINKTKLSKDLTNLSVDFSNTTINNQKNFDPNLSNDNLELTKPRLTEDLSDIHEDENEDKNEEGNLENNDSENNSIYDEGEEEEIIYEKNIGKNNKTYIHIKDEITTDIVKEVFYKLSPYINENDEDYDKNKKDMGNNKEILRKFNKEKSSVFTGIVINCFDKKRKSGISFVDDNILYKKDRDLNIKIDNEIHKESESLNYDKEEKNKIINSVFIENVKNLDLEIFSELIEILSLYPFLKRISFCDFHFEKEFEGWENIVHLINENNNIRWLDLHKSNMNNQILDLICKVIENKRIRYLDLSENFISQDGARILGNFLCRNKTLQRLILNNNDLEDFKHIGISRICDPLILHPNIQHLDFSSMVVTGCGESVANLIKTSKTLKSLFLRDCLLNLKDFQFICRALATENISKTIKNIDLSHNDLASDKSLEEIGKMIKANKSLTYLNLEKMNINMNNYNIIFNALNENELITHFSFCFNPKIKPRIVLEYFLHRKKLSSLAYIPYKANINDKEQKVEFNLEEKKIIEKFKKKRKKVKLITN